MSSEAYYRLYSDSIIKLKKISKQLFNEEKPIIKFGTRYCSEHFTENDQINIPRHLFVGNTYLVRVYEEGWEDIKTHLYQDGVVITSNHVYDSYFLENKKFETYYDIGQSKLELLLSEEAYSALSAIKDSNLYCDIIITVCTEDDNEEIRDLVNKNYEYLIVSKELTLSVFQGIYL